MNTSTTTKHTAEPWQEINGKIRGPASELIVSDKCANEADLARIVACVNACAGMEDPAAAIASAKRALERAIRCASPEWDVHEIADYKNALRALGG